MPSTAQEMSRAVRTVDTTRRAMAMTGAQMDSPFYTMDMTTRKVTRPIQGRDTTRREMSRSIRKVHMTGVKVNLPRRNMSHPARTVRASSNSLGADFAVKR